MSKKKIKLMSGALILFAFCSVFIFSPQVTMAFAQNQTQITLDSSEARVLNSICEKWGISAPEDRWNISGEPCTGAAIDATSIDDIRHDRLIKCDCSFDNHTLCHITALKVCALNVKGGIPDELWTLTYLTNLNLAQNYLTGSLSASIGNLTRMQYLGLGMNALSGELPKELGDLTDLRSLVIGANNFSGPLPYELGNLSRLGQLCIDSSGVSGEIPPTFANLRNLTILWASDNEFTGGIPDFIGSWSKLTVLRFQGNSFEGAIPSAFSNLTSLTELRISDLSNGSSSLAFIKDLKSLKILELRNNNISDSIPSNIGEYQSLLLLDLSFNNLSGQIPDSLFNLSSLAHVFLGNNRLTGTLPAQKSASLVNIDLSYNNLAGSFPSWVNEQNLQLNLVANNFTIGPLNSSYLPLGLNCLQQDFPCNRGSGIYYDFRIKCGGPQITSSNAILFERDNEILGSATYFVTGERWAVSNVGYFAGSNDSQYNSSSSSQFTNTLDSDLFQTGRLSASSLRYYGLGLENGNYTVTLQFAETAIQDSTWKSLGRRIFDIYIQENLVSKEFDIRREAGGVSNRAVQKKFKAKVSENYIEIHLFWAGRGTCCIPAEGTYGPSISAISATADFEPTVINHPPTNNNRTYVIVGIVLSIGLVSFVTVFAVFCIVQRRIESTSEDEELQGIDAIPCTYSYAELKNATADFNPAEKLGEGGFGPVYKGTLQDGRVIAVKQLSVASHQGNSQFIAEIAAMSVVQHPNLVKLYGCCIEGAKRLLVYEYLENKSLDLALFGKRSLNLKWPTRYDICLGIARGLAYLHEESRPRIIHRDMKASNILLDSNLVPKISDFGLAKLYDDSKTHISTCVAGTIGYLAPEYAMRGHLTEKADVFAFGVVALETVSGRLSSDTSLEQEKIYLLEWAWHLHENNHQVQLVDSHLPEFNEEEVKRVIGVALLCTQTSPMLRPPMSRVVAMLSGDVEVSNVTSKPGYLTDFRFEDISSSINDNTTSGSNDSYFNSCSSTSMVADAGPSSGNSTKPMHRS